MEARTYVIPPIVNMLDARYRAQMKRPGTATMDLQEFLDHLRSATEDDVNLALRSASIDVPLETPTELLELFNCILDIRVGEEEDMAQSETMGCAGSPG